MAEPDEKQQIETEIRVNQDKKSPVMGVGVESLTDVKELGQLPQLFNKVGEIGLSKPQRLYLAAFAKCGRIRQAARMTGIDPRFHYNWLKLSHYAVAFDMAREIAVDGWEEETARRGFEGVDKPCTTRAE